MNKYEEISIDELVPYEKNARTHSDEQIRKLVNAIEEFGFIDPVVINKKKMIMAGHGRVMAAKKAGLKKVPCLIVDHLTEDQVKAYIISDNKLAEDAGWDDQLLHDVLVELNTSGFDVSLTGFDFDVKIDGYKDDDDDYEAMNRKFKERMAAGEISEEDEEYQAFLEKFELKKTTDDCYTPDNIYEAVRRFVVNVYHLDGRKIIRPFYPGGDFQNEEYPDGCVVIDNPPFSILSEICEWYENHNIDFFLFAPALTLFSTYSGRCKYVATGCTITYQNGANVQTSFVTNLGTHKVVVSSDLFEAIDKENEKNLRELHRQFPRYEYPDEVVTSSKCNYMAIHGENIYFEEEDLCFTRAMDQQKEQGKAIFGGGFYLSERAAAERAAAERIDKHVWELSQAELEIIKSLGKK